MFAYKPNVEEFDFAKATTYDIGKIAALHAQCFDEAWTRKEICKLLGLPGSFGIIVRSKTGIVPMMFHFRAIGFAICRVVADECELLSLGIAPDFRQYGLARGLLEDTKIRCYALGARKMFLEVCIDNEKARSLYTKSGFEQAGVRPGYYKKADGRRLSALTMCCHLVEPL